MRNGIGLVDLRQNAVTKAVFAISSLLQVNSASFGVVIFRIQMGCISKLHGLHMRLNFGNLLRNSVQIMPTYRCDT